MVTVNTCLLANKRSERDTIRGVPIQELRYVYTYIYVYMCIWTYVEHNSSVGMDYNLEL